MNMTSHSAVKCFIGLLLLIVCAGCVLAQAPPAASPYLTPIGPAITLENAKKAVSAALAETRKNGWLMVAAVVDPSGTLVYYEKMDNTQLGSAEVAIDKARSAALYKRPTKAFQDALAGGGVGLRVLGLRGAEPVEGGLPIIVDGRLTGAIGLSGDTSEHDGQCAAAGVAALK
jgi:glc operon protein GlcG